MAPQGLVSFPGIVAWEDFQFTDLSGISPAAATMQVYPQAHPPALQGDIVLTYDGATIRIRNCIVDAASYQRNSGGQIVWVRFLDERWRWAFYSITGRYNIKLPNDDIDPVREKTPRELATLCFEAMEVANFDVSALPNDARPEVDWESVVAAQELARLCDDLGCRIVPRRSDGAWVVCVTGVGAPMPDNGWPYQDAGEGIDPKESPDVLAIVTAPVLYQCALKLEPVGKDIDLSWRTLDQLSYRLSDTSSYGFGTDWEQQSNISATRQRQPDGTLLSPQELALQTVWKC